MILKSILPDLGKRTLIMGVLNVTPDSFSDGGLYFSKEKAVARGVEMIEQGADLIDVGGESTRPGSERVSGQEELKRVLPVVEELSKVTVPISIDSYKASVAEKCLRAGAQIINDVSALRMDARMIEVASEFSCPVVLMHMKGEPKTMQANPVYEKDVVREVKEFLQERTNFAVANGVDANNILVDPGIGFGKTLEHNLELLRNLGELKQLGKPLLVGTSRKSFIGKITGLPESQRLEGTIASVVYAIAQGADIVRVHDVHECKRAVQVADAIARG